MFEKLDIKNLEILNLGNNQIKNIDVFENVNFKDLKNLYLENNDKDLTNLKSLKKFKKLEVFHYGLFYGPYNIVLSESFNLDQLKELNLSKIDCSFLCKINLDNLEILCLKNNCSNINFFENLNFPKLTTLTLTENSIPKNKNIFNKFQFNNLSYLNLDSNDLQNINFLEKTKTIKFGL